MSAASKVNSSRIPPEYLYLLFDDSDHIPLDQNVFNTEVRGSLSRYGKTALTQGKAHILPVFKPNQLTPFSTS